MKPACITILLLLLLALCGCKKGPPYCGTYRIVLSPAMQKVADEVSKSGQKMPNGADAAEALTGTTITLNADGTFEMGNIAAGGAGGVAGAQKPTYTLVGSKLTVRSAMPGGAAGATMEFTYNEKDQTISGGPGGVAMTFKKE